MKFNLKQSIDHVCKSIKNTPLRIYNGVRYQIFENFFSKDYLKMLQDVNHSVVRLEGLETQNEHGRQHRRRVSYAEPVSKNLQVFFHSSKILNALQDKFNCDSLKPKTADMWFDYKDYKITPHIDSAFQMQLQIYLNDESHPSTAFFDDKDGEKIYDIVPYKSNAGYCLYNQGPSWHGMTDKVVDGVRKSVFARFVE